MRGFAAAISAVRSGPYRRGPRDLRRAQGERIARWLAPGGLFLASVSRRGSPDRAYNRLVREAGFEPIVDELVFMREPEPAGEIGFRWMLARV